MLDEVKFITEDQITKSTNITAIYNQYLIRNYLQKILRFPSSRAWIWVDLVSTNKGGGAQKFEIKLRTAN